MADHSNSSEITLRDVWEQLNFFRQSLDTIKQNGVMIETKMDFVMQRVNENDLRLRTVEQLFAILNDVPERLTRVEHRIWSIPSLSAILAVISLGIAIWTLVH